MLPVEKMDRLNALARKMKQEGLTPEEKLEQAELREEYLKVFREGFKRQLDSIEIVDP
jgi:uncharacterized protein YnzC (UPF0291/DUF896 family)